MKKLWKTRSLIKIFLAGLKMYAKGDTESYRIVTCKNDAG